MISAGNHLNSLAGRFKKAYEAGKILKISIKN